MSNYLYNDPQTPEAQVIAMIAFTCLSYASQATREDIEKFAKILESHAPYVPVKCNYFVMNFFDKCVDAIEIKSPEKTDEHFFKNFQGFSALNIIKRSAAGMEIINEHEHRFNSAGGPKGFKTHLIKVMNGFLPFVALTNNSAKFAEKNIKAWAIGYSQKLSILNKLKEKTKKDPWCSDESGSSGSGPSGRKP